MIGALLSIAKFFLYFLQRKAPISLVGIFFSIMVGENSSIVVAQTRLDSLYNMKQDVKGVSVIDSLLSKASHASERQQLALYNQLSIEYFYISLDKAKFYQGLAHVMAEKLADSSGLAEALLNAGFISRIEGELDQAFAQTRESASRFERSGNKRGIARAYFNLGLIFGAKNDYFHARRYLLQSLDKATEAGDTFQCARSLNGISEDYFAIGEPQKALEYGVRSLELHKSMPDKRWYALQLDNVGYLYENMKQSEQALQYYQEAYSILMSLGRKGQHRLANSCKNIANALRELRRFDEGIIWAKKGIELQKIADESLRSLNGLRGNYRALADLYEAVGKVDSALYWNKAIITMLIPRNYYTLSVYEKLVNLSGRQGNISEALQYADLSWQLASLLKNPKARETATRTKAEAMRLAGQSDSALFYLRIYLAIHDSLNSIEKKKQIERLHAVHDIEQKENENRHLLQENLVKEAVIARQTFAVIAISISLIATIVIIIIIYRANHHNKQVSERLININAELDSTITELQQTQAQLVLSERVSAVGMLTAGVMHEINNPNAAVYAALESIQAKNKQMRDFFLGLLDDEGKQSPEAKQFLDLNESTEKMSSVAKLGAERVKHIVASLRTFTKHQEFGFKKTTIRQELEATAEIFRYQFKNVEVRIHVPQETTIVGNIAEINQVFLNLLVNAAQADATQIVIQSQISESGRVIIIVSDNGKGMDSRTLERIFQPFFSTKTSGNSGLGLSISQQIMERHSATITVQSDVGKGTTFQLEFPPLKEDYSDDDYSVQDSFVHHP